MSGVGMFVGIAQQLLDSPKQRHLDVVWQATLAPHDGEVGRELGLVFKALHILLECRHKPQIVKHHGTQCQDKVADLVERDVYRVFQVAKFHPGPERVGVKQPLADLGLQNQVVERLSRSIVHLRCQSLALAFLSLDDAHDIALAARRRTTEHVDDICGRDLACRLDKLQEAQALLLQSLLAILQLLQLSAHHE